MSGITSLYSDDFLAWTKHQAGALRRAAENQTNQLLDWENLAEEIEGLGTSQKAAVRSQLRRIIQHLLKLEFSPAAEPRRGRVASIIDARSEIEDLLETSPSLKPELGAAIPVALRQGAAKAIAELEKFAELGPDTISGMRGRAYTQDQILGDWFPPGAADPPRPGHQP